MKNKTVRQVAALLLFLFAGLTFFLSSSVIFDLFGIREKEGQYVLFVVWANWLCSLLYFTAVVGFLKNKKWTAPVLFVSILLLAAALAGLHFHIGSGGLYEAKTIKALIFRSAVTLIFTMVAYFAINKKK